MEHSTPNRTVPILGILGVLVSTGAAQAQLVTYAFTGNSMAPTSKNAHVNASDLTQSWGGTPTFNTAGNPAGPSLETTGNITGSMSPYSTYYAFSLQAGTDPGYGQLKFQAGDTLTFYLGSEYRGGSYTVGYQVSWSTDNVNFTTLGSGTYTNPAKRVLDWAAQQSISLATLDIQSNPTMVYFRLYIGDNSNASADLALVDALVVNGSVVPEPAVSAAAVGLGLLGLAAFHRRRRNAA
ncbi:MAG TPA: MYXO-CTERM sorting domain-containing protein [Verrucomicrobiota bacterium]|nr:MYXO-CTERM sorting domain-containing protein [Verrucomicrobiota bacterium]HNU52943.1 MYXO-CTERM sorting domain-containing protein [Verrucomicrobiota bacterium]